MPESRVPSALQQFIDEEVLGIKEQLLLAPKIMLQWARRRAERAGDVAEVHPVQALLDDGATGRAGYRLFSLLGHAAQSGSQTSRSLNANGAFTEWRRRGNQAASCSEV